MGIEITERAVDRFRHAKGKEKSRIYREHKKEIIAQALKDEGRHKERDEFLNRSNR